MPQKTNTAKKISEALDGAKNVYEAMDKIQKFDKEVVQEIMKMVHNSRHPSRAQQAKDFRDSLNASGTGANNYYYEIKDVYRDGKQPDTTKIIFFDNNGKKHTKKLQ